MLEIGYELELGTNLSFNDVRHALKTIFPETHKKKNIKEKFTCKADYSIESGRSNQIEIVTPVWNLKEGIENIERVFDFLDLTNAVTNNTCGLHVNIGPMKGIDVSEFNPIKLAMFSNDDHWLERFKRKHNQYSKPFMKKLQLNIKEFSHRKENVKHLEEYVISCLFYKAQKYDSINLAKFRKNNYIEFRSLGNRNYHKRRFEIQNAIKDFSTATEYSLSKKKEKAYRERLRYFCHDMELSV